MTARDATPALEFEAPELYINQEASWLAFNQRVLEQAADEDAPLLERLKFLAIFSNNLDEYFMVRVAGLKQQVAAEVVRRSVDGRSPAEQLQMIGEQLRPMLKRHAAFLREDVLPRLAEAGIELVPYERVDEATKSRLRAGFIERVFPVLTPLAVDRTHPFPYISNLSLSLAVEMEDPRDESGAREFARVKVPASLPRFVALEEGATRYVLFEQVIAGNLDLLFPGMRVTSSWMFRATRDADLDLQEDEADDLLGAIESELRKRRYGEPVRLEVETGMPQEMRERLLEAIELEPADVYESDIPLATVDFWQLVGLDVPSLHDRPFTPAIPARLAGVEDIFRVIREGDLLLQHPYDSFDPVLQFIRRAADDPKVLAIKQTVYRASGLHSPVLHALSDAAEAGKQVAVVIEVKARFDEENNIEFARRLERVGAHVVYGSPSLKTHAKVTLVVREEADGLRRYVHIGTGNYNERTARVYTDLSLFSCDPALGRDASQLFNAMTGYARAGEYEKFLVAPTRLRSSLLTLVERETANARAGRPARIFAKMNALTDVELVRALYRASCAGVEVDLLVRGICILRPGVPGVSERIRVRSLIGRFLEHSRIFVFHADGAHELYFGSADWMSRNLDRRIELVVPLEDPAVRARTDEMIALMRADTHSARELRADGTYARLRDTVPVEEAVDAQSAFLRLARAL